MKKLFIFGILSLLLFTAQVNAELKVGVVNFKLCVEKSKLGKHEQEAFENMKKQIEEVLQEKEKNLNEVAGKLNDPDFLDSLSPDKENELKHEFRQLNQEMSQYQSQYYQILNQANFKIVQKLTDTVGRASKTIAERKKMDIVMNEETCFYASNNHDITNDVVVEMDKIYAKMEKDSK